MDDGYENSSHDKKIQERERVVCMDTDSFEIVIDNRASILYHQ